eukprot:GHVT01080273.1.p1 GENE.GHVT01080273.1~~GHVT01080273.1.p1  ORF type:complete len:184 (+),score=15.00 GHVT01080273.1:1628-2179(+)
MKAAVSCLQMYIHWTLIPRIPNQTRSQAVLTKFHPQQSMHGFPSNGSDGFGYYGTSSIRAPQSLPHRPAIWATFRRTVNYAKDFVLPWTACMFVCLFGLALSLGRLLRRRLASQCLEENMLYKRILKPGERPPKGAAFPTLLSNVTIEFNMETALGDPVLTHGQILNTTMLQFPLVSVRTSVQ